MDSTDSFIIFIFIATAREKKKRNHQIPFTPHEGFETTVLARGKFHWNFHWT